MSLDLDVNLIPSDWSADDRFISYLQLNPKTKYDLWVLPLEGDRKPFPFLQTQFNHNSGRFSPDGHWIAYDSDESGKYDVYVQTFPGPGGKWPISTKGGTRPQWGSEGKEIFYLSEGKLMAVKVKTGSTFEPGIPETLFDLRASRVVPNTGFAAAADGQRFIFLRQMEDTAPSLLNVVVNWNAELKK